jgi:hypothetical protein
MDRRRQTPSLVRQLAASLDMVDAALMQMESSGYLLIGDQEPSAEEGLPTPAGEVLYFAQLVLPRLETFVQVLTSRPAVIAAAEQARRFYEED